MSALANARSLAWATLMAGLTTAMASAPASAISGIFEVDLLFPQPNATYTPDPLMPVVFALQNPRLAKPSWTQINWALVQGNYPGDNAGNNGEGPGGNILFTSASDPSISAPHLITRFINTTAYPEGAFTLDWTLQVGACFQPIQLSNTTTFFTSWSGEAPDLVAATSADKCRNAEAYAFNVTGKTCNSYGYKHHVFGPTPTTTNPCAVTIDPAAASSISAEATARACPPKWSDNQNPHLFPNVTCPTWPLPASETSAATAGRPRVVAASTLLASLSTLATLIYLG